MNDLLRKIPKVDDMLARPAFVGLGGHLFLQTIRDVLAAVREEILHNAGTLPALKALDAQVFARYAELTRPNLRWVINGTGIVLHTNLGRAPLAQEALDAINETSRGYSTLEYDIKNAKRGSRHTLVESLLCSVTNAETAMVVNNNAAAVLLALSALAQGREVITSRGELVEIGGAFRIPDVCAQSGCKLVEVGTTNKTHVPDYANALSSGAFPNESNGAILRVHASNFKMTGFVSRPGLADLVKLANEHNIPLIEDLGSGALVPICNQPTVAESISAGADVVTFSGDKLLGGPQAGIIVGRAKWIDKMKAHPLARALRIDKLSLAALESTLRLYQSGTAHEKIPVLQMLQATEAELLSKANRLCAALPQGLFTTEAIPLHSQAGGGAMPEEALPSAGIAITHAHKTAQEIESHFRMGTPPIVGRIAQDKFLLDVRTIDEADFSHIVARVQICEQ
ncbi:MAG: L-seryl-tRNA(Sec) selenium transferase [Defluviitaleaceae bacterium]|nr:L-seryl-tRNA(Sec) selenium transferase [Defluviitaleaceae bacterium]MCL2275591.1 L-seryl-tRNA(Sec) selenium transferase [Defluviitaleaceae bacterium]